MRQTDSPLCPPFMPPSQPLLMRNLPINEYVKRQGKKEKLSLRTFLARLSVFGLGIALSVYGAYEMYHVVSLDRSITFLQWLLLILFVTNFLFISLSCVSACGGFLALLFYRKLSQQKKVSFPLGPLSHKTAILMPIYNEMPSRVYGALQAIAESLTATGFGEAFHYFILSDTSDPEIWLAEERSFLALRQKCPNMHFFYRHRPQNIDRKAGNIQDFITHWGNSYTYTLILDADSLMSGEAILSLVLKMEADPKIGILQTFPFMINRNTFFARLQQFAGRVYGPPLAYGLSLWMGREGNYWGHNALLRTEAFAQHCGLPHLPGPPPLGGTILSHDFVEAAFMCRAGYHVHMLPNLEGSYEESPPSLIDLMVRDRRWCQGNLQHIRLLFSKGLKCVSRYHFLTGIMAYLSSPLWMGQILIGGLVLVQANYIRPEYFTSPSSLFPQWPRFDADRALALFMLTILILLIPKLLGWIAIILQTKERKQMGGTIKITLSLLIEILMSALFAPIAMLIQSGSVFHIFFGRDSGWHPQRREDGSVAFRDIFRRHRNHTFLGLGMLLLGFSLCPSLLGWMAPTFVGLLSSIGLSWCSGQRGLGEALRRLNLLLIPEESTPPLILQRANFFSESFAALDSEEGKHFIHLHQDFHLRTAHENAIPSPTPRPPGWVDPHQVMAAAKLHQGQSLQEVIEWLDPMEKMAVLKDKQLIAQLCRLPLN